MKEKATKASALLLIGKYYKGELTAGEKTLIENTPLSEIVLLGLDTNFLNMYLHMYAELFPYKLQAYFASCNYEIPAEFNRLIKFLREYPCHINLTSQKLLFNSAVKAKFYKHMESNIGLFKREMLPSFLKTDPEINGYFIQEETKIRNGQLFSNKNEDWTDKETGLLIRLFTVNGTFPFKTKEDYIALADEYRYSQLLIPDFCKSRGISNPDNFKRMIDKLNKENKLNSAKEKSSEKRSLKDELKSVGTMVLNESILSFEDYLEGYYKDSHSIALFEKAMRNEASNFSFVFSKLIYEYLMDENTDIDPVKLASLFGVDFRMITQAEFYSNTHTPLDIAIVDYTKYIPNVDPNTLIRIIKEASWQYGTNNSEGAIQIDGKLYDYTVEDKDAVIDYMNKHGISISHRSFRYRLIQYLTGELEIDKTPQP